MSAIPDLQPHRHGDTPCTHGHSTPDVTDTADALIAAHGLSVVKAGRALIDGVAITLKAGEIVTLIGPNGAGKTTLVRVLLGLETPTSGHIRRRPGLVIGYVPQKFDIEPTIPLTVERFLHLGLRASRADIDAVLGEVGADRVRQSQVARLSGGELQRVVLARALLRRPGLLVLDEPSRGVDHLGEAELYALIARLRTSRGFGVLLVSHDLHIVMANADRVICLNGHVCCSGHPETVAQHPEYARLFGADAALAFGVYTHHHDHDHDLAGSPRPRQPGTYPKTTLKDTP